MSDAKGPCGMCHRDPAAGFASMWTPEGGEVWLCHGDDDPSPTCYESVSALSGAIRDRLREAIVHPFDAPLFLGDG